MPKEQIIVVAAIIQRGDKYLITQRLGNTRYLPLKWEFPGGKVEFGEDPKDSLIREIAEELGAKIRVFTGSINYSSFVYDKSGHVILLAFNCYLEPGPLRKLGVKDFKWVTLKQMVQYDFCEADLPFVEMLQNR